MVTQVWTESPQQLRMPSGNRSSLRQEGHPASGATRSNAASTPRITSTNFGPVARCQRDHRLVPPGDRGSTGPVLRRPASDLHRLRIPPSTTRLAIGKLIVWGSP